MIAISFKHIPESRGDVAKRVDGLGAVLATVCIGGLLYGFIQSELLGWRDPRVLGGLLSGVVCLVIFVFVEARAVSPMVPLELFKSPSFSGANLLTLLLYSALGIFFFLFPMNLIQVQGYSATAAGAAALPTILLMFVLSRWAGGLVARYGPRTPLIIGPVITAAGFILFAMPSLGGRYWTSFFPAFVVLGLGLAVSVAPLTTVVMGSVEQDKAGTASGINNAVARVAGVLAIAILGVAMVKAFSHNLQQAFAGMQIAPDGRRAIQSNLVKLAAIQVPAQLDATTQATLRLAIARAFVFGFRLIVLICAGLSVASAGVAWRMIPSQGVVGRPEFGGTSQR